MITRITFAVLLALVAIFPPLAAQRFMHTGATDAEVLAFFDRLQRAVGAGNKATVAGMVHYPLHVNSRSGPAVIVANAAELIAKYDAVFTPAIRRAIGTEKPAGLLGGTGGAAIGGGLVWLTAKCDKAKPPNCVLGILSVNHE